MDAQKVSIEITVDFSAFDKSAKRLARVGGVDGNAFVDFGTQSV